MIFFTSDHHFYHTNIIKYCARPFSSVEEMNDEMVSRWNSRVKPEDTVYYLGDFAMAYRAVEIFAPKLNGEKILIMGNHDLCHPHNKKKAEIGRRVYEGCGFKAFDFERKIEIAGNTVLLNHFPYRSQNPDDKHGQKYAKYRPTDEGGWLLCGHIHEKWKTKDKMINVGVDVWNFFPVSISEIERIITGEQEQR